MVDSAEKERPKPAESDSGGLASSSNGRYQRDRVRPGPEVHPAALQGKADQKGALSEAVLQILLGLCGRAQRRRLEARRLPKVGLGRVPMRQAGPARTGDPGRSDLPGQGRVLRQIAELHSVRVRAAQGQLESEEAEGLDQQDATAALLPHAQSRPRAQNRPIGELHSRVRKHLRQQEQCREPSALHRVCHDRSRHAAGRLPDSAAARAGQVRAVGAAGVFRGVEPVPVGNALVQIRRVGVVFRGQFGDERVVQDEIFGRGQSV